MRQRRSFKKQIPLDQRLAEQAKRLRKEAKERPGLDETSSSASPVSETGAQMGEWLSSPGQRTPR